MRYCMEILFCILLDKISIHFICWFHDIKDIAVPFFQPSTFSALKNEELLLRYSESNDILIHNLLNDVYC